MAMAGLWDHPAAGQEADTFAIVTVESSTKLAPVSRQPLCPDHQDLSSPARTFPLNSIMSGCR